jgi:crotonobetainyl-CoA:carnitine CoA-transferase CaiB-like acyl-CoA transferase
VLELGHIVAGPTAGQILGDLGAEVIKIESPNGGDQARNMPGSTAAMFHFLNRDKRSVALDLKGGGKAVFLRMVRHADIVIDNYDYGVVDRLGVGYAASSAVNARLIWLTIKGYLPGGDCESLPLLDELAQMAGGLAFMTGTADKPMRAGASVIDIGAASYGVIALLAALRQREQTGQGQFITSGLYETSVYWVAQWMAAAQFGNQVSVPMSQLAQGSRMGFGVYSLFATKDESSIFVGVVSDGHWARFCRSFGLADLRDDARFMLRQDRVENKYVLANILSGIFGTYTLAECTDRLRSARVPFAPVRRPDQLAAEAHLNQSAQLMDVPLPNGVSARLPKLPFRASGFELKMRRPAPALGADTSAVLLEMGLTPGEIDALRECGSIAGN